ncbi:putative ammonium transporter 1 isoform X2 [Littorina saxatilis]|uniref:Ammonium transporter n=1 Tax=Littorina saxatilis TaxID=31220 RepID=A0AAN9G793_9CAEN
MEVTHAELDELKQNLDQFFLIVNGMLVFLMQCGFAFLEAGSVRSKNSTNILIKNLLDSFVAGVAYWVFGFAFAFGPGNKFIGYEYFASAHMPDVQFATFFFQYVFAATAATIVSGALAERCEFVAYFVYSFLITSFIYPVVTHWVWSGEGWLSGGMEYDVGKVAYKDFAGSGVVHVVGGTAAFMGALIIGPRIGRFHSESNTTLDIRGHSVPFAAMGGFILLFGFLAFNGGSELSISNPGNGANVALSVVNTIISGSVSAFFTMLLQKTGLFGNQRWSLLTTLNGALTGMVAACAGCNVYYPWGAAILGFVAAICYKITSWLMVKMKVDDPLDAVAVHFGGGTWGVIAVAFLNKDNGILLKWDQESGLQLAWQLAGFVAIVLWTGFLSLLMFGILRLAGILRVSEDMERKGLDIPKHGEPAYPLESYGHGHIEKVLRMVESGQLQYYMQGSAGNDNAGYTQNNGEAANNTVNGSGGGNVVQPGYENPEVEMLQQNPNDYVHHREVENTPL